jgi:hypothetical protein
MVPRDRHAAVCRGVAAIVLFVLQATPWSTSPWWPVARPEGNLADALRSAPQAQRSGGPARRHRSTRVRGATRWRSLSSLLLADRLGGRRAAVAAPDSSGPFVRWATRCNAADHRSQRQMNPHRQRWRGGSTRCPRGDTVHTHTAVACGAMTGCPTRGTRDRPPGGGRIVAQLELEGRAGSVDVGLEVGDPGPASGKEAVDGHGDRPLHRQ